MSTPALGISDNELYARHVLALNTRLLCPVHGFTEQVVGHRGEAFILQCGCARPVQPPFRVKRKLVS